MSISICYSKYVGNLDSGKKMYSGKNVNKMKNYFWTHFLLYFMNGI